MGGKPLSCLLGTHQFAVVLLKSCYRFHLLDFVGVALWHHENAVHVGTECFKAGLYRLQQFFDFCFVLTPILRCRLRD